MTDCVKVNRKTAAGFLPARDDAGNKGSFGTLLALCGSANMPGAAYLASMAAMRCGVGLLAVGSVPEVLGLAKSSLWEAVYLPLPSTADGRIAAAALDEILSYERATAVLIGCGMGRGDDGRRLAEGLLEKDDRPVIIDADGLNCLAPDFPDLRGRRAPVIITPHMGEMSRLTGRNIEDIKQNRLETALDFSRTKGVITVLKDSVTHITAPDGPAYILDRPNSGLAKGGSGDVLAGCISSFTAQGIEPVRAAALGAVVHSRAGTLAAERMGKYGMMARDVIAALPQAIRELEAGLI